MKKIVLLFAALLLNVAVASAQSYEDLVSWTEQTTEEERSDFNSGDWRVRAVESLNNVPASGSDVAVKANIRKILTADALPITSNDLVALRRVRSTQTNDLGIYQYSYFNCKFTREARTLFFNKTAGSQRKQGNISRMSKKYLIFSGCWYIGGDQPVYDGEHHQVGLIFKYAPGKIAALFIEENGDLEVYEFTK